MLYHDNSFDSHHIFFHMTSVHAHQMLCQLMSASAAGKRSLVTHTPRQKPCAISLLKTPDGCVDQVVVSHGIHSNSPMLHPSSLLQQKVFMGPAAFYSMYRWTQHTNKYAIIFCKGTFSMTSRQLAFTREGLKEEHMIYASKSNRKSKSKD